MAQAGGRDGSVLDDRDGAQDVLGWSCRGEDRTQGGNRADERKTPRAAAGEATDGDSEVLPETEGEKPQPRTPTLGRPRDEDRKEVAMIFLIIRILDVLSDGAALFLC